MWRKSGVSKRFTSLILISTVVIASLGIVSWLPMMRQHAAYAAPITISVNDLISAPPRGSAEGVLAWARANGALRMGDLTDYVYEVYRLAPIVGIDPAIVIAQSAIETGNWTSSYWTNSLNPAGLGIHYDGAPSYTWYSGTDAARFQIALLYIYVNGPIPAGHILRPYLALGPGWTGPIDEGFAGKVKKVNDLSGRWAVDPNYGNHIALRGSEIYKSVAPAVKPPNQTVYQTNANGGNDPARVLDGDLSSTWAIVGDGVTPAKPAYLQLDLGVKTHLTSISWVFRLTGFADKMRIRVSEDGVTYTTIFTTGNAPAGAWQAIGVDLVARYVRFNIDNPNGDLSLGYISEVRFYGEPLGPTPTPKPKTPTPGPSPTPTNVPLAASGGSSGATFTGRIRDGRLDTDWRTTSTPAPASANVYIDLGSAIYLDSVSWVFSQTGGAPKLDVQISLDKKSWTTIATVGDAPANQWQSTKIGAQARYVRWLFTNTTNVPVLGYLAEVTVRSGVAPKQPTATATITPTPTPTNVALAASGGSSGATFTGRIRDGRLDTDWRTTGSPAPAQAYVYIDLGSSIYIDSVSWVFNQTGGAPQLAIQISSDKKSWTTIATAGDAPANQWQSAPMGVEARYVRWLFTNTTSVPVLGYLAEVTVRPGLAPVATVAATQTPTMTTTATVAPSATVTAPVIDTSALPEATPIAIIASSDSTSSETGALAFDQSTSTDWRVSSAGPEGGELTVDFGQPYVLTTVAWLFSQSECVDTVTIERSLDGVAWEPIATAGAAPAFVWQAVPASGSAQYLRWSFTNGASLPQVGCLAEVAAWGDQDIATSPTETATETVEATATAVPTEIAPPTEAPTEIIPETPTDVPTEIPTVVEEPTIPPEEPTEVPPVESTEAPPEG